MALSVFLLDKFVLRWWQSYHDIRARETYAAPAPALLLH